MMRVGFTGTQRGMTAPQRQVVEALLDQRVSGWVPGWFRHGDCTGADEQAHVLALANGWMVAIHPPSYDAKRAFCRGAAIVLKPAPYLTRNTDIVQASEAMIATPGEHIEQLRSGTWATIRRARRYERPLVIVYPDGTWITERWPVAA